MTPAAHARLLPRVIAMLSAVGIDEPAGEAIEILEAANVPIEAEQLPAGAEAMIAERVSGTPLAFLTGRARFMGVDLFADPGALAPRAETELLGAAALAVLRQMPAESQPRLIDMCCGAGNLACGLAAARTDLRVWACDLTDGAVRLASANVAKLDLGHRVQVRQGNLFDGLTGLELEQTIDVLVCNPPYISTGTLERKRAHLLQHEPREAFDGGPYGMSILGRVVSDAVAFLKPGGTVLLEFGVGQAKPVARLFERAGGYGVARFCADAAGEPRVAVADRR